FSSFFFFFFFFFQAEDGIRDGHVTGVQTCALPILVRNPRGIGARYGRKESFIALDEERKLVALLPGVEKCPESSRGHSWTGHAIEVRRIVGEIFQDRRVIRMWA